MRPWRLRKKMKINKSHELRRRYQELDINNGCKTEEDIKNVGSTSIFENIGSIIDEVIFTSKRTILIHGNGPQRSPVDTHIKSIPNYVDEYFGRIYPPSKENVLLLRYKCTMKDCSVLERTKRFSQLSNSIKTEGRRKERLERDRNVNNLDRDRLQVYWRKEINYMKIPTTKMTYWK